MQRPRSIEKKKHEKSAFCRRSSVEDGELSHITLFFVFVCLFSLHNSLHRTTAKKCTKIYNARAQLLFSSLNPFFAVVLVTVPWFA